MSLPRILLLSDLHLEMHDYTPVQSGYDMVVLAGDIHTKDRGVEWAKRHFKVPTLYVPGNHEGYGTHWQKNIEKMRAAAKGSCVRILEKNVEIIDGVRFAGATGWSSFDLWPNRAEAMAAAGAGRDPYSPGARDYRHIRTGAYRRILPSDTAAWSLQTYNWFREELSKPFNGPTVGITHHAPSVQSLPFGVREPLDATDANVWEDLMQLPGVVMWMHGHTHHPVDYRVGDTRNVSNPRGYPGQDLGFKDAGIYVPEALQPALSLPSGRVRP